MHTSRGNEREYKKWQFERPVKVRVFTLEVVCETVYSNL